MSQVNEFIKNFEPVYPSVFLNYLELFKQIGKNDTYLRELLLLNSEVSINPFKTIYYKALDSYKESVEPEIDRVIKTYMTSMSISLGEAMFFAEKHFEEEIGFLKFFIECVIMLIINSEYCDVYVNNRTFY